MKIFSSRGSHANKKHAQNANPTPAVKLDETMTLDAAELEMLASLPDPNNASAMPDTQTATPSTAPDPDDPDYDPADYDEYFDEQPQPRNLKRKIIIAVAVVAALVAGGVALANSFIQPPDVSSSTSQADSTFTPTITTEDGEEIIDPNAAIEIMGDRIDDYFTFVVAVTDVDGYHTDNIMVGSFDTTGDTTINLMNIPRDTMSVCSRDGAARKINAAYAYSGGISNTVKEVSNIVGFTPDRYVVLSFSSIAEIVDAIGGIEYDVPFRMLYDDPYQDLHIDLEPGLQVLDGEQAVEFLRWRKNNSGVNADIPSEYDGSDSSRIEKQQEFLMVLAEEVLQIKNALNITAITEAIFNNIDTDFTLGEILWMATQGLNMSTENINLLTLPGVAAYSYADTDDYLSFYFPNESKTLAMVNEYLNPYDKDITYINVYSTAPEPDLRVEETDEYEGMIVLPSGYTFDEDGFLWSAEGEALLLDDGTQIHFTDLTDEENNALFVVVDDTDEETDDEQTDSTDDEDDLLVLTPPEDASTDVDTSTDTDTSTDANVSTDTQDDTSAQDETPTETPDWLQDFQ